MSLKDMTDEEVVEMIQEGFDEDGRIRTDFMRFECHGGRAVISGRVGSDEELQLIEEIMGDVLEIHDFENTVWVDDELQFDGTDVDEPAEVNLEEDDEDDMDSEDESEDGEEE